MHCILVRGLAALLPRRDCRRLGQWRVLHDDGVSSMIGALASGVSSTMLGASACGVSSMMLIASGEPALDLAGEKKEMNPLRMS